MVGLRPQQTEAHVVRRGDEERTLRSAAEIQLESNNRAGSGSKILETEKTSGEHRPFGY